MEFGEIERRIRIDAAPEVVFDVVSNPRHVAQWWPDEANYAGVEPDSAGNIVFLDHNGERAVVGFQVVEAIPHRLFSFRWTHPLGERPSDSNSFLVRFELEAAGDGTELRMTETGFHGRGWTAAEIEETYRDHSEGWDYHLARLGPYVAKYLAGVS
jgi:uncharacterized protein YndB with AHSA1/START domain